jgi:hypothetical protein
MAEVYVAKALRDRKVRRALMQFFKPENYFTVREALVVAPCRDVEHRARPRLELLLRPRAVPGREGPER